MVPLVIPGSQSTVRRGPAVASGFHPAKTPAKSYNDYAGDANDSLPMPSPVAYPQHPHPHAPPHHAMPGPVPAPPHAAPAPMPASVSYGAEQGLSPLVLALLAAMRGGA